jgi:hypothetical protein
MKQAQVAGLKCNNLHELLQFSKQFSIPSSLSMLQAAPSTELVSAVVPTALYVPMDVSAYAIHGACFTGKIQIGQLVERPKLFVLHVDGKYKLQHLNFILLPLGTNYLRWDAHNQTLSTSFAPVFYLFCKDYGKQLDPGACMSDHSTPFRKGFARVWPDAQFGQCWPHIIGKVRAADGVLIAGPPIDAWLTLVDKGTPESALEMCGYRRKERIRSNPACTADLHTCELCSCECVRVCAVCAEVRASCASNLALGAGGSFSWPAHVGSESAFGGLGSREAGRGLAGQLCTGVAQALGRSL